MRIVFIITGFLLTYTCSSQSIVDQLSNRSVLFNLHPDSALSYFLESNRQFPGIRPVYTNYMIALCYSRIGDMDNAEKFYLQCLSLEETPETYGNMKNEASSWLSVFYFERMQFRKALDYLEFTTTTYKPKRRECAGLFGGYRGALEFAYTKSLCYYGLGEKDSAISVLAPLIFRPKHDIYFDSLKFENIIWFFVNTVTEVYGAEKAKHDLQQALKKLVYRPAYREYVSMGSSVVTICSVDCSINFAKTKINLAYGGGSQVMKKGDIPEYYSKEELIKIFTGSPAYQYLMTCDNGPVTFRISKFPAAIH